MQVKIKDEIKSVQVTSVILSHDYDDPDGNRLYMFHCLRCGSPLIQYHGFIAKILPGFVPMELPTILRCSNSKCKHYYSFQSIV